MSSPLVAVVFDHTALLALGAGSRMLSGLVSQAHLRPGRYIFALLAAPGARSSIAERSETVKEEGEQTVNFSLERASIRGKVVRFRPPGSSCARGASSSPGLCSPSTCPSSA